MQHMLRKCPRPTLGKCSAELHYFEVQLIPVPASRGLALPLTYFSKPICNARTNRLIKLSTSLLQTFAARPPLVKPHDLHSTVLSFAVVKREVGHDRRVTQIYYRLAGYLWAPEVPHGCLNLSNLEY